MLRLMPTRTSFGMSADQVCLVVLNLQVFSANPGGTDYVRLCVIFVPTHFFFIKKVILHNNSYLDKA